jgi:A-factor type gamma-butyrolactone 1'-reductase (1S-forming)
MLLEGKSAIITGGASGIGEASCRLFVEEGASVLIVDRNQRAGESLANELTAQGHNCHFYLADITSEPAVKAMIEKAVELFGRLDCAVNNAGIGGEPQPIDEMSLQNWQQVMDINLTSVFLCLKYELKVMQAQQAGAIVNIASGAGLIAVPNMAGYCATKHGVLGLTKTAATENIRKGIRVNAILPGSTRTPLLEDSMSQGEEVEKMILASVPCGRFGQPIEIAQNIVWLCSDRASYVSGESVCVDYATVCR